MVKMKLAFFAVLLFSVVQLDLAFNLDKVKATTCKDACTLGNLTIQQLGIHWIEIGMLD